MTMNVKVAKRIEVLCAIGVSSSFSTHWRYGGEQTERYHVWSCRYTSRVATFFFWTDCRGETEAGSRRSPNAGENRNRVT